MSRITVPARQNRRGAKCACGSSRVPSASLAACTRPITWIKTGLKGLTWVYPKACQTRNHRGGAYMLQWRGFLPPARRSGDGGVIGACGTRRLADTRQSKPWTADQRQNGAAENGSYERDYGFDALCKITRIKPGDNRKETADGVVGRSPSADGRNVDRTVRKATVNPPYRHGLMYTQRVGPRAISTMRAIPTRRVHLICGIRRPSRQDKSPVARTLCGMTRGSPICPMAGYSRSTAPRRKMWGQEGAVPHEFGGNRRSCLQHPRGRRKGPRGENRRGRPGVHAWDGCGSPRRLKTGNELWRWTRCRSPGNQGSDTCATDKPLDNRRWRIVADRRL